jgi:hypothetical protein
MIVEVLAAGRQHVVQPSVHPVTAGEYEWTATRTLLDTAPEELPILLRGDVEVIARALLPWLRGPMESRDTVSECRSGRRRTGSLTPLRNGVSARPER